ncbi:exosome complex exonuclease [Ignicoccus islandicus DSM 13165]|uniref:Exosome complex component Rrp42 n=1 Tax=Ignicoccus islandicus DSM 13165 TaxID=940295 RepID=A0A0U3E8X8_9CREN|nr:exosome complex protein Rrp42 [Ignicoccus islandicus]ALU11822.1 exosome complex exonuclease [Ignicoccus islandicus DSM 13165]
MSITPFNVPIIPRLKRETFLSLLKKGVRLDKRRLNQFRPITIEYGVATKAHGSALVSIGNTKVLVGVKIEPGRPFPDLPEEGVLNVNAELVPLASPEFEPGPPDENAIELARVVDRALRETPVLDTSQLVLIPGEKVWVVWVDIYVLDHDGNLFDAAMLASMAALLNAKIPEHEVKEDGTVEITGPPTYPLPIINKVVSVTLGVIDDSFIVDPNLEEENIIDGKVFFAFDEAGNVVGIQKSGPAWIDFKKVQVGFNIARSLYQHPLKILLSSLEGPKTQ